MNALTIFIRRPVLATMVTVLLLVLGVFSLRSLGVDLMPKVEFPIVTVTTVLRGASPEEMESQITKPIEEAVNTVSGVDELTSYSREGVSIVVVRFVLERPPEVAAQDVRDKVATVVRNLPVGTDPPVVAKVDFDAFPVMTLTVSGDRELKEVSEVARLQVKEALENVDGVGAVNLVGARKRAVNVVLEADRLKAYGIPIAVVKAALATQNVEVPSGRIDRGATEQVLRTLARVEDVEGFSRIVVATRGGKQVTIGDLGRVEDSVEEPRTLARVWHEGEAGRGLLTVSLDIVKQSGTNTVQVIHNVKKRLDQIMPALPPGFAIDVVSDQSRFIERSIDELKLHLVLGGLLAALAVLVFMRSFRATIIAALAIPSSLIATFTLMRAQDFTLNNMTLLGLTLAVGIVIDDSIVVLENIFRHMEQYGKSAWQASIDGLKEIGLAVMATTTSLMVIFLPIAFMEGIIGRFMHEFGMTVAFAIGISLVISFTLTPMLSARFLKLTGKGNSGPGRGDGRGPGRGDGEGTGPEPGRAEGTGPERGWMVSRYGALVDLALRHRWVTVLVAVLCLVATVPVTKKLGKDFLPQDDRSEFQVSFSLPGGTSLAGADALVGRIEDGLHQVPGITKTLTQIGATTQGSEDVTTGRIYIGLEDLEKRGYSQTDKMREVRKLLVRYPEVRSSVNFIGMAGGGSRSTQLQYNLVGTDLEVLARASDEVARKLRTLPGFVDVDTSLATRQPELRVTLDRQKAADLGISATDIASTLRTMVGGEVVTKFREGVEQYDVWLRLEHNDRSDASLVETLPLLSARAGLVPLAQVSSLSNGQGPTEIDRFNRRRMVSIFANLDGLDLGRAGGMIKGVVDELQLPPGYGTAVTGQAKAMGDSMRNMMTAFLLAFIFMYIVLAAQFESFLHPVTILLSLPLTLPFAMLSLLVLGDSLNIYSLLGVFMLFGIVKKNGILQIDYTNTLRAKGVALREAIVEANMARLRPILMTTLTLIAGMTPIALGQGPGAASRASLAKVIIGGQALSLFITLLIVPVAYSGFESLKRFFGFRSEVAKEGTATTQAGL